MTPDILSLSLFDRAISAFRCNGGDTEKEALNLIGGLLTQIAGSSPIPYHDHFAVTYIGSTNNIGTVTYKVGGPTGTVVAVNTLTYVGDGAADDDLIETSTIS